MALADNEVGAYIARCIARAKLRGVIIGMIIAITRHARIKQYRSHPAMAMPRCVKQRNAARHGIAATRRDSFQLERMLFSHPAME